MNFSFPRTLHKELRRLPEERGQHRWVLSHLEPHPAEDDEYDRQFITELPNPTDAQGDWAQMSHIVDSRIQGKAKRLHYLIRRKNMGPAWDVWRAATEVMLHAPHLIDGYKEKE
jgi:hypothetical protein